MTSRFLMFTALLLGAAPGFAHDYSVGELVITQPWSRELPAELPGGSAYFTVVNQGSQADRLVRVSSPRAQKAELHSQAASGGMMSMQETHAMEIPANTEVTFQPGANHVMLTGMEQPLKAGEQFAMTLEFEKAGQVEVLVDVGPVEAQAGHAAAHVH